MKFLFESLIRRDVFGVCWHLIAEHPPEYARGIIPCKTPAMFERDLDYLERHYEIVSYGEAEIRRRSGQRARRPAVILTFDDGYRECFTVIAPLLRKRGLPAVFFLTTDFLDNLRLFYRNTVALCLAAFSRLSAAPRESMANAISILRSAPTTADEIPKWLLGLAQRDEGVVANVSDLLELDIPEVLHTQRPYLTRDEAVSLSREGFTLGSHGRTHVRLRELTSGERAAEVIESTRYIRELSTARTVPFAFPFSGDGVPRDELKRLRNNNPSLGLLFDRHGMQADDPCIVHRIVADSTAHVSSTGTNLPRLIARSYRRAVRSTFKNLGKSAQW